MRTTRALIILVGSAVLLVTSLTVTAPAAASPEPAAAQAAARQIGTDTPLADCVAAAVERQLLNWTCVGGTLNFEADGASQGGVEPGIRTEEISPPKTQDVPSDWDLKSDDYDTWCENGSVCTRKIGNYVSETKGNAAWGTNQGVKGTFDNIMRTGFSGRQPQYNVSLIWDSGPSLTFSQLFINCREDQFPIDSNCGVFDPAPDGARIGISGFRFNSKRIFGNRLNDVNPYYGTLSGYFIPDGYPEYVMGTLRSGTYFCGINNAPCIFN